MDEDYYDETPLIADDEECEFCGKTAEDCQHHLDTYWERCCRRCRHFIGER